MISSGRRDNLRINGRKEKIQKQIVKKGPWSSSEDEVLKNLVNKHGPKRWSLIAEKISHRTSKQCRERWHNHLQPNISKARWTVEEDDLICKLHVKYGNKWTMIAKHLAGRTENGVKNRWNSTLKRKMTDSQDQDEDEFPKFDDEVSLNKENSEPVAETPNRATPSVILVCPVINTSTISEKEIVDSQDVLFSPKTPKRQKQDDHQSFTDMSPLIIAKTPIINLSSRDTREINDEENKKPFDTFETPSKSVKLDKSFFLSPLINEKDMEPHFLTSLPNPAPLKSPNLATPVRNEVETNDESFTRQWKKTKEWRKKYLLPKGDRWCKAMSSQNDTSPLFNYIETIIDRLR